MEGEENCSCEEEENDVKKKKMMYRIYMKAALQKF